jgi:hypothetical protein
MKLGAVAPGEVLSPADAPVESLCVYHLDVPLAAITCEPEDLAHAKTKAEAAAIQELAEHLRHARQLFPCRLVRMLVKHVENKEQIPDRDGCLYGVVSGLRIVLALVAAGHSHVRAEVLPAWCEAWPIEIRDDPRKIRAYEREWALRYLGSAVSRTTSKNLKAFSGQRSANKSALAER